MKILSFSKELSQLIIFWGILVSLIVLANPIAEIDILLVSGSLLILGHLILKEKLLLAFLIIRPALDYWRDFSLFEYKSTSLNVNALFGLILLVWCAYTLFVNRKHIHYTTPISFTLPALSILMIGSIFYGVNNILTFTETIKFLAIGSIFFTSFLLVKAKILNIKEFIWAIAASAIIPVTLGLIQFITGAGITTFNIRGRVYGTFGHPNVFSFYLLFLIILLTQFSILNPTKYWKEKPALRNITYFILILLLLLTYTRAAMIGLVAFLVIIGFFRYKKILAYLIGGIVGFYLIFFPLNSLLVSKANVSLTNVPILGRVTSRNEDADSFSWRQSLLQQSIPIMAARPIVGYGYGTFAFVWEENRGLNHLFDDSAESHNDYLRFALELGIVGLILYILMLLRLLQITLPGIQLQKQKDYLYLFSWVAVFMLLSLSDNMINHTPVMWMMWSMWGAGIAKMYQKREFPNLLG